VSGFVVLLICGDKDIGGTDISYLLFVYATLIFHGPNPKHLCHLWCLFLCFEAVLGLKINLAKSKLLNVRNVDNVDGFAGILDNVNFLMFNRALFGKMAFSLWHERERLGGEW
jgi:hypothetical protein